MARMLLLLGAGYAGLLVMVTSCIVSFKTRVLPRWLTWLGIVMAIVLLFDVIYVNILPFRIWVVAASIVLVMRREEKALAATSSAESVA